MLELYYLNRAFAFRERKILRSSLAEEIENKLDMHKPINTSCKQATIRNHRYDIRVSAHPANAYCEYVLFEDQKLVTSSRYLHQCYNWIFEKHTKDISRIKLWK